MKSTIRHSPFAMLRENLQNAYDAVRQRFAADGSLNDGGKIFVAIEGQTISITDNGIGMSEDGPHSDDDIISLILIGRIGRETLVWQEATYLITKIGKVFWRILVVRVIAADVTRQFSNMHRRAQAGHRLLIIIISFEVRSRHLGNTDQFSKLP